MIRNLKKNLNLIYRLKKILKIETTYASVEIKFITKKKVNKICILS